MFFCPSWQESHLVAEFVRIPRWIACELSASGPLGSVWLAEFSRILLRGETSDKVAGPLCSLLLRSRNLNLVAEFVRIPRWFACELSASGPLGSAWLAEFSRILLRGERVIRWLARSCPCSP